MSLSPAARAEIDTLRSFNRTVTAALGALDEGLYDTEFSLSEARIVRELDRREPTEVADLRAALGLDSGYLAAPWPGSRNEGSWFARRRPRTGGARWRRSRSAGATPRRCWIAGPTRRPAGCWASWP